jgi:hypothetical protein
MNAEREWRAEYTTDLGIETITGDKEDVASFLPRAVRLIGVQWREDGGEWQDGDIAEGEHA